MDDKTMLATTTTPKFANHRTSAEHDSAIRGPGIELGTQQSTTANQWTIDGNYFPSQALIKGPWSIWSCVSVTIVR